ncbi:hypothetical protein E2C01_001276 [Portunus trituberculatus]|uniref:Uncharacterized protein n=1 Tax=Portunus trituberculatus TaxID=210409 RepID=A0A5B7CIZ9_PORTR|nr:hypothetical protein [Portunus trituberculatus]
METDHYEPHSNLIIYTHLNTHTKKTLPRLASTNMTGQYLAPMET